MAIKYIKEKQPKDADWDAINKREFYCKAVNSILMTNPNTPIDEVLEKAKVIVDKAFELYPDAILEEQELPL